MLVKEASNRRKGCSQLLFRDFNTLLGIQALLDHKTELLHLDGEYAKRSSRLCVCPPLLVLGSLGLLNGALGLLNLELLNPRLLEALLSKVSPHLTCIGKAVLEY